MLLSLIFFVFFFTACRQKAGENISIRWSGNNATGITIPQSLLANNTEQDFKSVLQVSLQDSDVPMLGEYRLTDGVILFTPLLPLSPGKMYEVFYNRKMIGQVQVPLPDKGNAPELISIYPSADTLPENLLKFYVQFSSPMRESEALRHIHLINESGDTLSDVFLDLQPELWNSEGTTLTLWLDPGRIKRELIPNQRLGNPLKKGNHYQLVVDSTWKDQQGLSLKQGYTKRFFTSERDQSSPQPGAWTFVVPNAGSNNALSIHFHEPLDYFLLPETIQIVNDEGIILETSLRVMNEEKTIEILPNKKWKAGWYRLRITSYLEDLAGNNLNRLFDRDVNTPQNKEKGFGERLFEIR